MFRIERLKTSQLSTLYLRTPSAKWLRKSPEMVVFLEDFDPLRQFHLAGGGGVECKSASPYCFFGLPPITSFGGMPRVIGSRAASCAGPELRQFARRSWPPLCEDCPRPPRD